MRWLVSVALVAAACTAGKPSGSPATASPASETPARAPVQLSTGSPFPADCAVTGVSSGSAVEPDLAVDPWDPRHLAAVWQADRVAPGAALGNVAATSRDGGRTWSSQPLPHLTRCDGGTWTLASDPWVSIGAGGAVYASSLLVTLGPFRTGVAVSVAAAGGDSWSDPVVLQSSGADQIDKPAVLADPRVRGAAYAVWVTYPEGREEGRNRVWLTRTVDRGRTWSAPRVVRDAGLEDQFSQLLPGPSAGSLFMAFDEAPVLSTDPGRQPATVKLQTMRSGDGGRTWTHPVTAASFPLSVAHDPTGAAVRAFSANLSAALGPRNSLYLGWCSGSNVFVARSGDNGATWMTRTAVQDSTQTFLPTVAAAGDGTVGVSWYDFRDDHPGSTQVLTDVWLGQSLDAGRTWFTDQLDGPFDLRSAPQSTAGSFVGDYEGLVGLPSGFAALYVLGQPRSGSLPSAAFFAAVPTRR